MSINSNQRQIELETWFYIFKRSKNDNIFYISIYNINVYSNFAGSKHTEQHLKYIELF